MNYGEAFDRLGVNGMGRQGSGWCGLNPEGVLVLMAHQNFFKRTENGWIYEMPKGVRNEPIPHSARRSIQMIADYFQKGKPIVLPVGVFADDGATHEDGSHEAAVFQEATGEAYQANMNEFDRQSWHLICEVTGKFSL